MMIMVVYFYLQVFSLWLCMKGLRFIIFFFIVFTADGLSQGLMEDKLLPTRQDSLRGSITPEREWWDLTYYHLDIKVEPDKKFISGSNTVGYKVLKSNKTMQIDLQEPMENTSVISNGKPLKFNREGNACLLYTSPSPRDAHESRMPSSA